MTLLSGSVGRVVLGLVLGGVLGVVGLPRLDLPAVPELPTGSASPTAEATEPRAAAPEAAPTAAPTPAVAPEPVRAAVRVASPRVLIDEHFRAAITRWPDDPEGTAWFAGGAYQLYARQPTHFVALGVPLPSSVGDAVLGAQFRKLGGPAGGGYGFILRDQGPASDRDGHSQDGRYLVAGVGDRGDVGVWQRDRTRWIDVMPWTHSATVHQERETNSLVVKTRGSAVRFEVNGQVVADLTYDGLPATGGIGIFVGGDLNQVALEWLRIEG